MQGDTPMMKWTSDELIKIETAEELEDHFTEAQRHAAAAGDDMGCPPRRRPLCPIR